MLATLTIIVEDMYSNSQNRNQSKFVFALAHELKQYLETNAAQLDPNTYDREGCFWLRSISNRGVDNINYWRGGILSKRAISDEDLSEIIEYIPAEKLQELIELASSKTTSFNN